MLKGCWRGGLMIRKKVNQAFAANDQKAKHQMPRNFHMAMTDFELD